MGLREECPSSSINAADGSRMAPSTLDLLILTFNCAKNLINASVFASHLHTALLQNAAGLPDLVVFSLQEVAPLSHAFIGPYFLDPYYVRFGDALNVASERVLAAAGRDGHDEHVLSTTPPRVAGPPYTLVRAKNVGMTAILLYARDPAAAKQIEEAECGFGAADMGNKGAVGLRVTWSRGRGHDGDEEPMSTELTFVATHMAAMEWNLKKRNSNWRSIVSCLTFANPRSLLPGVFPAETSIAQTPDRSGAGDTAPRYPTLTSSGSSSSSSEEDDNDSNKDTTNNEEEEDTRPLLPHHQSSSNDNLVQDETHRAKLQSISIFKPTSHLFVAGDLNYRIAETTPPPLSVFPSFDPASPNHYSTFFHRDQLTRERKANRTCHGLSESPVTFGPTYKYDVLDSAEGADNRAEVLAAAAAAARSSSSNRRDGDDEGKVVEVVPWRFARHRWPGWCDRVLWLDVAPWVVQRLQRHGKGTGTGTGQQLRVETLLYDALPVLATSDHRPVVWRGLVPVLGAADMAVPTSTSTGEGDGLLDEEWKADPRVRLPVPVDVHAWERRARARRRELVVGWSAFLWSTKEGALLLATVLALGVGGWWFLRGW